MRSPDRSTAIVIGASMAGLVTARVLSDHADRVVILERDQLPADATTRRGVPQGRHAHALLAAGQRLLDGWFPGLVGELVERGAVPIDTDDAVWHQAGAHRVPSDARLTNLSMTRPLLEATVRDRLLRQCPDVTLLDGVTIDRPLVEDGRVVGVLVDGTERRADLVVDCTGRNTRSFDQLSEAGYPMPEVSEIRIGMAYGTRLVRRSADDRTPTTAVVIENPTDGHRIGVMIPVEGDRSIITVGSFHGEVPPTDPVEFEAFTRTLPSPELADVLARAEGLTPVLAHRMPTSQRRHTERLDRTPPGFLALGDAICSFNPIYGQGMSSAALQAQALERTLRRHGLTSPELTPAFYRRAAEVVDLPWKIAAGGDFADPRTTGPKPAGTDFGNRYIEKVLLACHTSRRVARQMLLVQNMLARPTSLMTPAMVARVLLAARRSPVARRPVSVPNPRMVARAPLTEARATAQAEHDVLVR